MRRSRRCSACLGLGHRDPAGCSPRQHRGHVGSHRTFQREHTAPLPPRTAMLGGAGNQPGQGCVARRGPGRRQAMAGQPRTARMPALPSRARGTSEPQRRARLASPVRSGAKPVQPLPSRSPATQPGSTPLRALVPRGGVRSGAPRSSARPQAGRDVLSSGPRDQTRPSGGPWCAVARSGHRTP
ncbi:CRISPR-associated protein Cas5 [Streptomyces sp. NPDC054864]